MSTHLHVSGTGITGPRARRASDNYKRWALITAIFLVFGAFPEEQRGLANGIFGIPVLVAPALGPVIGGYLAQYVDWRWIFYLNLPIGLMGILIGWRMLHESLLQRTLPFDVRGFLLIASGLGLVRSEEHTSELQSPMYLV